MPRTLSKKNAEHIKRVEEQIAGGMIRPAAYYETLGLTTAQNIQTFEARVAQEKNAILADENKRKYLGNLRIHDSSMAAASPRPLLILALQTGSPEYVQALLDAGEDPNFLGPINTGSKSTLMFLLQKQMASGAMRVLDVIDLIKVKMLILGGVSLELYSLAAGATPARSALGFAQVCEGPAKDAVIAFITDTMQKNGIPLIAKKEERATQLGKQNRVLRHEQQRLTDEISRKNAEITALEKQLEAMQKSVDAALLLDFSHSSHHSVGVTPPIPVASPVPVASAAIKVLSTVIALTAELVTFSYPAPIQLSGSKRPREEAADNTANKSNRNDGL